MNNYQELHGFIGRRRYHVEAQAVVVVIRGLFRRDWCTFRKERTMMMKDCGLGVLVIMLVIGLGGQSGGGTGDILVGDPCVADIQPPPFGDGDVDYYDLIMVINGWGACCRSDVFPASGDGKIDVNDLIFLINQWGVCEGCTADVFPEGGDGVVDILDLIRVVNDLGFCTETANYDCLEDFLPPGGDGLVNILELVGVVNGIENCAPTAE